MAVRTTVTAVHPHRTAAAPRCGSRPARQWDGSVDGVVRLWVVRLAVSCVVGMLQAEADGGCRYAGAAADDACGRRKVWEKVSRSTVRAEVTNLVKARTMERTAAHLGVYKHNAT